MSAASAVPTKAKEAVPTITTFNISKSPVVTDDGDRFKINPMLVTGTINSLPSHPPHELFLANVAEMARN
jgi:hypothetical protein